MAHLGLIIDDVVVNKFDLEGGVLTIGRSPDNDVQIEDHAVSSYHAQIIREEDPYLEGQVQYLLEDLKSTNATKINGLKVDKQKLINGDLIEIGYSKFRFIDKHQVNLDRTAVILPE
ncbi:FHA domain-containing protein [Pleionea mediterranea]|jgi:pSer/pThr/pTyr-binding forkhead associated (FHA) protein|uniref:FHA domain-containing protein n=1 Tax=Pleionea mediterranea TaxID=523701 RepID=A0A316FW46_9GAMM|nr:FHA domain-containing protein [Pleionea mediterranea]PWK53014.1 FHA domain-containing protein [Pleionea mediterranea]